MPARTGGIAAFEKDGAMWDLLYLSLGAAFLGACVLFAYACDTL